MEDQIAVEIPQITKAQQILDILEPIPAQHFITNSYGETELAACAIGHVNRKLAGNNFADQNGFGTRQLTHKFLKEVHGLEDSMYNIAQVNNRNDVNGYTEPVIKDRVLHLLKDMVAAGY